MNPLASHWLRLSVWLFIAAPAVAFAIVLTQDGVDFGIALAITLYVWFAVCVILASVAFVALLTRLLGRGLRALRR